MTIVTRDSSRIFDEYLVASAVAGDKRAMSRLVERWQLRLLRHAWRVLGDRERAKDVVQEAWIDIVKGMARLSDVAAFPAWAYRIVTRRCLRAPGGPSGTQTVSAEELEAMVAAPEHASGEFETEVAIVKKAISQLSGTHRATLALFYLEGLSVAEIAIATDAAPGTVKTRLMHAREKARELLEGGLHEQVRRSDQPRAER